MKDFAKTAGAVLFWIVAWQVAALAVGNRILLAGPVDVLAVLAHAVVTLPFWASIGFTFTRILAGFCCAFALALACGVAAWKSSWFRTLLHPLVSFVKSVPVVCIIVLLLMWMGSANVAAVAVALMVFPPVYFACLEGLGQTDRSMRQMLDVFRIAGWRRLRFYYVPVVMPYLIAAAKVVVGVSWKAGVAAEIIGIPTGSVGAGIYLAKIGLDSASLFTWTFAVVALSALCEKAFLALLNAAKHRSAATPPPARSAQAADGCEASGIAFQGATFSYGGPAVLRDLNLRFDAGKRYCLMAPSGAGKTTLLDLASGLLSLDAGTMERPARVSRSFQDDRLLDQLSAWGNVALVCPHLTTDEQQRLKRELDEMLGADSADLPLPSCSGGMKRKVSLMRALAAPGSALLLDEPFAGLDDASRTDAIERIKRHRQSRTLVVVTHDAADAERLDAAVVHLHTA